MLRNKDERKLVNVALIESQRIAIDASGTERAVRQLRIADQNFDYWLDDLTDERLIEEIPRLTKRLDYICRLAVDLQKATAQTILSIHSMRETLEKLATRKANREKEEAGNVSE